MTWRDWVPNYYDFYGTSLAKPSITTTISDQEIAAVLSVFLDYMLDTLNAVPVLTSDGNPTQGATTFYIGNNTNMPTALKWHVATFQRIPDPSLKVLCNDADLWLRPD